MNILYCALAGLGLVASYLTWTSNKQAPEAYEDDDGFHLVRCDGCNRFKKCGGQRQCVLGYPTRSSFFHGRRRPDGFPVPGSAP